MDSSSNVISQSIGTLIAFLPLIVVFTLYYYFVYKYPRTYTLLKSSYTKNGVKFLITTKHYRRAHISRKRRHTFVTVVEGEKILPNLFLDSHYKDKILYATDSNIYDQNQRVSLEGDFDKYFTLYSPKGLENIALTIITPDVMLILRDALHKSDMQITGHIIVLTTNEKIEESELLYGLYNFLDKIVRSYKFISHDEQLRYSEVLVKKNSVDEAIKIRTVLFSAKSVLYWIMFLTPGILYVLFFLLLTSQMEVISINGFIMGLAVALAHGLVAVIIIFADDKEWIDLEKLTR